MPNQTKAKFIRLKAWWKRVVAAVDEAFFPADITCIACGRELKREEYDFCSACAERLEYRTEACCSVCGDELLHGVCPACEDTTCFFERALAPFAYHGVIKELILRYKRGAGWLCRYFAKAQSEYYTLMGEACDLVTFVPTHYVSRREKGFDHACEIARRTAQAIGLPFVTTLKRIKPAEQKSHDREQRKRAVSGAFVPMGAEIGGKRILLVDDVMSTGCTVNECARVLKKEGAASITVLTVAR